MRERLSMGFGAALVTVLLWASAFVGIRAAGRALSAGPLTLGRLLVGSLALGALMLARRERLPRGRDLPGLIACGVLWFGAYNIMLNQAEHHLDAGTAAMIVNCAPVFIALLSGVFLAEGLPLRLMLGCAVALAGCGVIALATSTHGISDVVAALLCVAAALAYAVALVVEKPLLTRASPLTVTWSACTVGAVVCLPFLLQLVAESLHAGAGALAWVVYLGLLPTAAGFSLWAFALARTTAGRLGATTYLVPPVAVLMGWLLLGDVPQTLAFAGGALCLLGVAVARGARWPRRRRAAAEPVSA